MYEKLGGEEKIANVVNDFYDLVLADNGVNSYFKNTDMDKQRQHQTKFISYALGGPNQYTGGAMTKAHSGMNLQSEHFNSIVGHLRTALEQNGASANDIDAAIDKVDTLRSDILHK